LCAKPDFMPTRIHPVSRPSYIYRFYEPYAAWRELLWIGICSKNYYEKVAKETGGTVLFGLNQIYAHTPRIEYHWLPKSPLAYALSRIRIVK